MKKIAFFCLIILFSLSAAFAAQSRETLNLPAAGSGRCTSNAAPAR